MPCGKRANIEVPSVRHAEHISLSEKKKKKKKNAKALIQELIKDTAENVD